MDQVSTQIGKLGNYTRVIIVLGSFMEWACTFYLTKKNTREGLFWEKDINENGEKITQTKSVSLTWEIGNKASLLNDLK